MFQNLLRIREAFRIVVALLYPSFDIQIGGSLPSCHFKFMFVHQGYRLFLDCVKLHARAAGKSVPQSMQFFVLHGSNRVSAMIAFWKQIDRAKRCTMQWLMG